MAHEFLSDDWLDAVLELRDEFELDSHETELSIVMNQVITDVPFGDGRIEISLDTRSGFPEIKRGHVDDAEVTITTDYETAKSTLVHQDASATMQAFMSGRILIQGDLAKLMTIQAAAATVPPSDTRNEVARRLKQITLT